MASLPNVRAWSEEAGFRTPNLSTRVALETSNRYDFMQGFLKELLTARVGGEPVNFTIQEGSGGGCRATKPLALGSVDRKHESGVLSEK